MGSEGIKLLHRRRSHRRGATPRPTQHCGRDRYGRSRGVRTLAQTVGDIGVIWYGGLRSGV